MRLIFLQIFILMCCGVFGGVSTSSAGGVTFDFSAISKRRFAVDEAKNIIKEPVSGKAENSFEKIFVLPKTNATSWRVSLKYRMRHAKAGASLFKVEPGPWRAVKIQESGRDWSMLSVLADVPEGTESLKAIFTFAEDSEVLFEYKDFSITEERAEAPIVLKQMPMGNLDGRFAVSKDQCGMVEYYWRKTVSDEISFKDLVFTLELPKCVEFVGANFARANSVQTAYRADGGSEITFACSKLFSPQSKFDTHTALAFVVKGRGEVGDSGLGRLVVKKVKGTPFEVASEDLRYFIVDSISARKPTRFLSGVMTGHMLNHWDKKTIKEMSRTISDSGVTWLVAKGSQETYSLWRSLGIRRITPSAQNFCNGYQIGIPGRMPKEDKYEAYGVDKKSRFAARISRAACPVSIYEGSDFFKTNTVPYIQNYVKGTDGCWSNWEPMMFTGKGCMCQKCCKAFSKHIGKPYEEISAIWPKCIIEGGIYYSQIERFRSLEHAKVVKAVDKVIKEVTGGDSSLGLIPGVAWIEMSSWWRPRNYLAEMLTVDYAGSMKWMNPWGPYVAWESDMPYVYAKRKPLCHFFAAQDILDTVKQDHKNSCPNLMALIQGFQCGHWVSQPEHIGMALDSYFFNQWNAAVLYYFPRGYDARYWKAFADSTTRAARFENFVLDGERCDSLTAVVPFPGIYAKPVKKLSDYLPACRDVSPLQSVSYELKNSRIVSVFNFWQKGEAYFTLKVRNLSDGRYEIAGEDGIFRVPSAARRYWTAQELSSKGAGLSVGAARTHVFEIRPYTGEPQARIFTDVDFDAQLKRCRQRLEQAVQEDIEYEKENGEVPRDSMPVI